MPASRFDIPQKMQYSRDAVGPAGLARRQRGREKSLIIHHRACARIGLIGNPSDGYYGKTISCCIRNFSAEVTLWESPTLHITPNTVHDPVEFSDLEHLTDIAKRDGYYGGLRLLFATCKRFHDYCHTHDISLPRRNFTVSYETNIPRQVGLGGSSAIIVALFRSLMQFFEITEEQIPRPLQPNIVLSVEKDELDIAGGLQDRVVQTYGGTVYMDFNRELMHGRGYGYYEPMDPACLPPLFLAYVGERLPSEGPTESGHVHNSLRFRFESGDPEVLAAITRWAALTEQARQALLSRDDATLATLINANFDLRRRILGDAIVGRHNLRMVEIARSLGHPAKLSGSGGAVVGLYHCEENLGRLRSAYEAEGYRFEKVEVARPD
jgi:glucuronokinase